MARGRSPSLIARMVVWGRAGGRCQFAGCGKRLDGDLVTGDLNKNQSYLAHIIASDPGGKRGDPVLSHQLSDAPENLMLMCDPHHREISATVGDNETAVPLKACIDALTPMFTLADRAPIDIKIRGMDHKDSDPTY